MGVLISIYIVYEIDEIKSSTKISDVNSSQLQIRANKNHTPKRMIFFSVKQFQDVFSQGSLLKHKVCS